VRLSVKLKEQAQPLHAVLTATNGRAFSVSFSRPLPPDSVQADYSIEKVTQAWLSNFDKDQDAA
jgi:hypothetical protein